MNARIHPVLALALALGAGVPGAGASPSQQVPTGPRAIAMGGAFSAVVDDASSMFWNPAGLARIGHQEIAGTYADLYRAGIKDNRIAAVLPLSPRSAAGFDWYHSGLSDSELDFGENRFSLSYAIAPFPRLSVGATAKYLTRDTALDGVTARSGRGVGADLGVQVFPGSGLRLALVDQDAFNTKLHYADGGPTATAFPHNLRWAAAYTYRNRGTLAFDVDDRVHLGVEALPLDQVALRAGFQRDRSGNDGPIWSFGTGFRIGLIQLDYAYEIHPVLANTSHFGFSLAFNFNPTRIRIERVETEEVYASLYKTYASRPIGVARVRNLDDKPLTARLSVFVPGLMDSPTEREIVLRPKAVQDVPLVSVFSDRIMGLQEDRPVPVEVTASYRSARVVRTDRAKGKAVVYQPGAIDWEGGVAQAAAFVTLRDPVVDATARRAVRVADGLAPDFLANRNLAFTAALFDALGDLGVTYVPDPNNPYTSISETEHAVDTVHYPRETLEKRAGDCDDTSVLMAALLGNVGIATQFVDVPGHLMILVATGVHERNRLGLAVDDDLLVIDHDQVWIPLETTAVDKGFTEAWRKGADAYRSWEARDEVKLVDVSASQSRYEAALPPGPAEPPPLEVEPLRRALEKDGAVLSGWRNTYLAEHFDTTLPRQAPSEAATAEIARVYYLAGRLDEAKTRLTRGLTADPGSARLHNDLAVVLLAGDEPAEALGHLEKAVAAEGTDPGIWLNLGLCRTVLGDEEPARRALRKGIDLGGGMETASRLLGLLPEDSLKNAGVGVLSDQEVRELLETALQGVPPDTVAADSTRSSVGSGKPPAGPPPPSPRLRVAAARAVNASDLEHHFYWKP